MRFELAVSSFAIEINTSGTVYLRTSKWEIFAVRDKRTPCRFHHEVLKPGEGVWSGMGWEFTYSRLGTAQIAVER